jgi:glycosyltransferase involved in cell wall biosynthesis
LKTLHVIDRLGVGGAETWLMALLRHWREEGDGAPRIDFLATSGEAGVFDEEARALGAKIFYLRFGRRFLRGFAQGWRRILAENHYNVLHDHQDYISGWHFLLAGGARPPLRIAHVHNPAYQILNNYGVTVRRRLIGRGGKMLVARLATHIAGTSEQIVGEYGMRSPHFARIPKGALYCGFDPVRFNGDARHAKEAICREFAWPADARIILSVGRLDVSDDLAHPQNHKNSGFSLAVALACLRRDARVRMLFAGATSPAQAALQARIDAAGATGKIVFAGIRDDIATLMAAGDLLLFPSRGEGLGMAAVEAQAAGLPVLASTAVPRECCVVPDLVEFEALSSGETVWAERALQMLDRPRDVSAANARVARSAFAISNSARALRHLYTTGTFG